MSNRFYASENNSAKIKEEINNRIDRLSKKNIFETALVIDFVSNPRKFLKKKVKIPSSELNARDKIVSVAGADEITNLELYQGGKKVNDTALLEMMPPNSIIGYNVSEKNPEYMVLFPFFPTHISLPVKPGEKVWFFYDNSNDSKVGYWLHRKTGTRYTEDTNYTDHTRQSILSLFGLGYAENIAGELEYKKTLHTFFNDLNPEKGYDDSKNFNINRIHSFSTAYQDFKGAVAIPEYKKCSDLILQGSNNTKIVLTNSDISNTGEIKLISGYKRDFPHKTVKNNRPLELKSLEYEEYDKFQDALMSKTSFNIGGDLDLDINISIPKLTDLIPIADLIPKIEIPIDLSILNIPLPNLKIPSFFDLIDIPNPLENIPKLPSGFDFVTYSSSESIYSEDLERDGKYKITEPAVVSIKEFQTDQSFVENVTYDTREGFGMNMSSEMYTGNIHLKTNASQQFITQKPRNAEIDMLGSKILIKNSEGASQIFDSDGNIIIFTPSNQLTGFGPHVILGGNSQLDSEPVIRGEKLIEMLTELVQNISTSIVATPAGPSGPLTNSVQISALVAKYLTPVSPKYIGSVTTRVK